MLREILNMVEHELLKKECKLKVSKKIKAPDWFIEGYKKQKELAKKVLSESNEMSGGKVSQLKQYELAKFLEYIKKERDFLFARFKYEFACDALMKCDSLEFDSEKGVMNLLVSQKKK